MAIRTPDSHLRVFVSSTLKELADERKAVRQAILKLRLAPVMFESGARPHPPRDLYQAYLTQSQIFIGIYWQSYGWIAPEAQLSGLEDEYVLSAGMPRLIYIKDPAPDREQLLTKLLDRIKRDNTNCYSYFSTTSQLKQLVLNDLALLLAERFERSPSIEPLTHKQNHLFTNLPFPRNPILGRDAELSSIHKQLLENDAALLTLTGPGGTGKSRLAIQAGLELLPSYKDGAYLVKLESIHESSLVMPTIAEVFGLHETPDSRPINEMVSEFLHDKSMLLVLDNFEHVIDAAPFIGELLEACPKLKCIVTSRAPLRLRAEIELPVPPLHTPNQPDTATPTSLSQCAAVQLFIQRAQAVKPDFSITDSNALVLADICLRLDGLPLAIELAAARIKLFNPQTLLEHLEHRFDLLTSGTRDLPERQRTLRGTIDWSYNLLGDIEKVLFRRLSVFSSGCTLEAMNAVCDLHGDLSGDIENVLASLIDKNLVIVLDEIHGETHYGMLGTIQAYAIEHLIDDEERESVFEQMAHFYLDYVIRVEPRIRSAERVRSQQVLHRELNNIRQVLEWVSEKRRFIDIGQQIIIKLGLFWQLYGYLSEGQQWCNKMLQLCDESTPISVRAALLCYEAFLAWAQGDQVSATITMDSGLELSRQQEDLFVRGNACMMRGVLASAARDIKTASAMFKQAIKIFKSTHDLWFEAISLSWLGDVAIYQNDPHQAQALHKESIRLARIQGDPWCAMPALMSSAQMAIVEGDLNTARQHLLEAVNIVRQAGDNWSLSWALTDLAHVNFIQGKLDITRTCLLEGLSLANTIGNLRVMVISLVEAAAWIASQIDLKNVSGQTLVAQLCGATVPYIDAPGIFIWYDSKKIYEDSITRARSTMPQELWNQGYADGMSRPISWAITYALKELKD